MKRNLIHALTVVATIACLFALNSFFEPHFDFNSFWGAGRALLQGRNPYDYSVIKEILSPRATANFNYPLYIAALLIPLGLFDLETAKNLWLTASEILLVLSVYLLTRGRGTTRNLVLSTVACAVFVPTLVAFFDQQTSMLALFLLAVVYYGLERNQHALAGVALALSLVKPQTVALLALVTLLRLHRRGVIAFGVTLASMLIFAFGLMPEWPVHWWASATWISREAGTAVPTIWGLSWYLTSQYWLGILLFVGLLGTLLLDTGFPFVLTVGLLLPVYMKPYDLVLLFIPALQRPDRKLTAVLVVVSYLLLAYIALSGGGGDVFILVTLITLAYLLHDDRLLMIERVRRYRSYIARGFGLRSNHSNKR